MADTIGQRRAAEQEAHNRLLEACGLLRWVVAELRAADMESLADDVDNEESRVADLLRQVNEEIENRRDLEEDE